MKQITFQGDVITEDDLYFICYMIERIGRKIFQHNSYIINHISYEEWMRLISLASVLHSENPKKLEQEWIEEYKLEEGDFDRASVNTDLVDNIPTATQMAKVYKRLILSTIRDGENYIDAMIRVYNDTLCLVLDDYNTGAYYEPSYFITRAYNNGGF